jgi:hypothetical protein
MNRSNTAETPEQLLPTIALGRARVTRLIMGGNPISGVSHQTPGRDQEMVEYFSVARIKEHLDECARRGVNTFLTRGDRHIRRMLVEYRAEGGQLQWIGQLASEVEDWRMNLRQIAESGAVAIYLHGSSLDNKFFKKDRPEEIVPYLKYIREELGLPAGMCSHNPDWLRHAEDRGWPVDWYMVCMYDLSKQARHSPIVGGRFFEETFDHADRERAFAFVRATTRPCVVFKALACGRLAQTPEQAQATLAEVYRRIKPTDGVCVGMWNKLRNEVAENAASARAALAGEV